MVRRHSVGSGPLQAHQQLCQEHPGGGGLRRLAGETSTGASPLTCHGAAGGKRRGAPGDDGVRREEKAKKERRSDSLYSWESNRGLAAQGIPSTRDVLRKIRI